MIVLEICKLRKISYKTFHRKSYFTHFRDFVYHLFSKIVWGNKFPFPTWSRPFDFSISNELFAFKTELLGNWVAKKNYIWLISNSTISLFNYKQKFGIKRRSNYSGAVFVKKFHSILIQADNIWSFHAFSKKN